MRVFLLLLFVVAGFAHNAKPEFAHVRRSGQIILHGLVEKVFPLFGPVEEAKWAPWLGAFDKMAGMPNREPYSPQLPSRIQPRGLSRVTTATLTSCNTP